MDKRFMAILGIIILIFVGIIFFSQNSKKDETGGSTGQPTNHLYGEGQTGVKLMEYGDFQCSVCFLYEPTIKQVREKYAKEIHFQFRNLPLAQAHPHAFAAARSAEAAGLQNKYWEMHDMIYDPSGWNTWSNSRNAQPIFEGYAQQLGLNMEKFKQDYASDQVNAAINADVNEFNKTGQPMATPTFFLDGKPLANSELTDENGRPDAAKFEKLINDAIAAKKSQ